MTSAKICLLIEVENGSLRNYVPLSEFRQISRILVSIYASLLNTVSISEIADK